MAVSKEAPIPNIMAAAAASRESLAQAVAELTETIASLPVTTVKRRLRDADIVLPFDTVELAGFSPSKPIEPGFAPQIEIKAFDQKSATEGLEKL